MTVVTPERRLTPEEQDERYMHLVPDIEAAFQAGYSDELIYHVWGHGLSTYETNAAFRDDMRERGVRNVPGQFMTHVDSKGHDFRFWDFFALKKAGNMKLGQAEALAIHSGGEVLRAMGVDEFTIQEFGHNVWGTRLGTRCSTVGQYTLCAADLINTSGDYKTVFRQDTMKLLEEKTKIDGAEVDELGFLAGSLIVLSRYRYINLSSVARRRESPELMAFYRAQGASLKALGIDLAARLGLGGAAEVNDHLRQLDEFVARLCPFKPQRRDQTATDQAAS